MSLTGNLEVFPLEEVLRLLSRSRKTGCLRVDSPGVQGRIFLHNGAVTLATTGTDDELRRQVLNAGLVTDEDLRQADLSGASLAEILAPGVPAAALTDFVRELVVESLFRIRRPGRGAFDFVVDMTPRYVTGQTFDAEVAVSEADRRATEWADIETVVSDLNAPIRMVPELPDENTVTIAPSTWRILAALEGGASVRLIASALGLSEFRAAREMAALIRNRLVEMILPVSVSPAAPAPEPEDVWATPAPSWAAAEEVETTEGMEEPTEEIREVVAEIAAEDRTGGWWSQGVEEEAKAEDVQGAPAEEADRFLESVFTQLGDEEDAVTDTDDETGFGMGLLRRRRMGAISRELNDGEG